jgi:site-specific recombinase XerD
MCFRWCVVEEERAKSPMPKGAPALDEPVVDVLTPEQILKLQKVCAATDFVSRRDWAIILTLLDTGIRREELATLRVEDVDLAGKVLHVLGKGRRQRLVPIWRAAARCLDRYDRLRARHSWLREHESSAFWLCMYGPMTGSGIYQVVRDRTAEAGIPHAYTHMFRHTASHNWRAAGGQVDDMCVTMGWSPNSPMPYRYGKSTSRMHAGECQTWFH